MTEANLPTGSQDLLRQLDESLAGLTGQDFFAELARSLAELLTAHCAFVTEFIDGNSRAKPLSFWLRNDFVDVSPYDLAGTPCECALSGEIVAFHDNVAELFPDDREGLAALDAKSYVAIPMTTRRGRVIGHIAVIDSTRRDWAEADVNVLRLCSSRASGELEHAHIERELAAVNSELELRVRERTRELELARDEMEQRVAERTAALAAVNTRLRHEVAARTEVESELRRREEAYRDLYENAPNVYWSTGSDGRIKRINRRAEELFGYTRAEFIGKHFMELVAPGPGGAGIAPVIFNRFLEGKPTYGGEIEFRAKDGRSIFTSVSVVPILDRDGKPVATRSVFADITERKVAERALERRLALERLMTEVAAAFVGARHELLDRGLERAIAKIGTWGHWDRVRIFLHDEDRAGARLAHEWHREAAAQVAARPLVERKGASGAVSVVNVPDVTVLEDDTLKAKLSLQNVGALIAVPVTNAGGVLGSIELVCFGRPHEWRSEDVQLLRLLGEIVASTLQRCAAERELDAARTAAVAASQAKSEFLARMSHELRTPLNAILGYAQLMQRARDGDPRRRSQIDTIYHAGEHLLALINEVLDLSRIEAGGLDLRDAVIDLRALTRDLEVLFRSRAESAGLDLACEYEADLPSVVTVDDRRLRQILINLLGNAIKFTGCGGRVSLRVSGAPLDGRAWTFDFCVEDTGIGIAADQLERVFEPFYQVDGGSRDGLGLGLAITRRLVEAMHGELSVTSELRRGTQFNARLTLVEAGESADAAIEPLAVTGFAGRPRTVLIADDRDENRAVLANLLAPLGFETREAADGESAVAAIVADMPDLALIDVVMPGLGGFEAVRRMRALPGASRLKIVAVSASAFEETHRQSLAAGCDGFAAKPVNFDEILALIGRLLDLEWLRAAPAPSAAPAPGAAAVPSAAPRAAPGTAEHSVVPPERLREIYEHAMAGDVTAIDACLKSLELEQPLGSFVADLKALTGTFDMRGVQTYLRPLLQRGDDVAHSA